MARKKQSRGVCQIDGCTKQVKFIADGLCQMHYFRRMRNGTFERVKVRRDRLENPAGYQIIYAPDHPLTNANGYMFEHRVVLFEKLSGIVSCCELCGIDLTWKTTHTDHIDTDARNNHPDNLRPLCMPCNIGRSLGRVRHTDKGNIAVTWGGETKTPTEWGRDSRIPTTGNTIRNRLARGLSVEDALFMPKLTHNGKKRINPPRPPKHTRKNAVRVAIYGELKTASEWSRHPDCPVTVEAIVYRIKRGWSHEDAVFKPPSTGPYAKMRKELEKERL